MRSLVLFDFAVQWTGPHETAHEMRAVRRFAIEELANDPLELFEQLRADVEATIRAREALFTTCKTCGRTIAPESGAGECYGCKEKRGIVF